MNILYDSSKVKSVIIDNLTVKSRIVHKIILGQVLKLDPPVFVCGFELCAICAQLMTFNLRGQLLQFLFKHVLSTQPRTPLGRDNAYVLSGG